MNTTKPVGWLDRTRFWKTDKDRPGCLPAPQRRQLRRCPGDEYELFYRSSTAWESLGKQKPSHPWVEYPAVPSNALLLLKNHSRGPGRANLHLGKTKTKMVVGIPGRKVRPGISCISDRNTILLQTSDNIFLPS